MVCSIKAKKDDALLKVCIVPKLFRIKFFPETSIQGMKLTIKKIRYIINHKKKEESSESIRKDMKISKRRVEQIWKFYSETSKEPIIGKNMGRPVKTLDSKEEEIISIAFDRYKFGARMLEKILDGFYEMHIPHNRIHKYLLSEGLAKEEQKEET